MSEDTGVIGRQLREARERMGLGVAQAAERLHVDENVIDALESGDFETLGPPVYVRGHLRHYAELVGEESKVDRMFHQIQRAEKKISKEVLGA